MLLLEAGPLVDLERQRGLKPVYELPHRGLIGSAGFIPRFRNLQAREKNFLRGYASDLYPGMTPDAKLFPAWGEELEDLVASHRGAGLGTTIMGEVLPRFENHVTLDPTVKDIWGIPA